MSSPAMSVVIPARNCRELLLVCLQCLARQTFPASSFEVIVVDDASTDGTGDAAEKAASELPFTITVVRRTLNEGPGAARNSGIGVAQAPIIALVDADTEPQAGWLEAGLKSIGDCDIVEGCTVIESRERITPFTHQTENTRPGGFPTCNMFLRKDVFDDIGLFDTRFYDRKTRVHFREDSDLALRAIESRKRITFAADALVIHRPLAGHWKRPIQLAKRYRHDRLLRQLHPETFSDWMDVYTVFGRTMKRIRQKLYWGYLAGVAAVAVSVIFQKWFWPPVIWSSLCLTGIWWLHVRPMGRGALSKWGLAALPVAMVVPFVYASSVAAGIRLHPVAAIAHTGNDERSVPQQGEPNPGKSR